MAQQVYTSYNYAQGLTKSDTNTTAANNPTFPPGGIASGGRYPDALHIGGAGTVICVFEDESTVTFTVLAGTLLPVRCKRIGNSSTGSLFIGLWQI
jgi:hypothetical protein